MFEKNNFSLPYMKKHFWVFFWICVFVFPQVVKAQQELSGFKGAATYLKQNNPDYTEYLSLLQSVQNFPLSEDSLNYLEPYLNKEEERIGDKGKYVHLLLYSRWYYKEIGNIERSATYTSKLVALTEKSDKLEEAFLYDALGYHMFALKDVDNIEEAIETAQKLEKVITLSRDTMRIMYGYRQLCVFYQAISDSARAIKFCSEGVRQNEKYGTSYYNFSFFETLAIMLENGNAKAKDSALVLRKLGIQNVIGTPYEEVLRTSYRNLAVQYSHSAQPDSAEKYFGKALTVFKKFPWQAGLNQTYLLRAEHYVRYKNYRNAQALLDTVIPIIDPLNFSALSASLRIQQALAAKNPTEMLALISKRDSILDKINGEERISITEEMAAKFETAKKEAKNERLILEKKQLLLYASATGVALLSLVIILYLLARQRKREKELAQNRAELMKVKAQQADKARVAVEEKFKEQQEELRVSINEAMLQQNRIGELMEMVEELQAGSENSFVSKKTKQMKQKLEDYSAESQLVELDQKAQGAYPILYEYLSKNLTSRSEAEKLFCIMLVMEYTSDDIARALKRSPKAVSNLRYRVRKRLGLQDAIDLKMHLVDSIHGG